MNGWVVHPQVDFDRLQIPAHSQRPAVEQQKINPKRSNAPFSASFLPIFNP